jgi:hypothetical protein
MSGYKCGQGQHMRGFRRVAALQLDICAYVRICTCTYISIYILLIIHIYIYIYIYTYTYIHSIAQCFAADALSCLSFASHASCSPCLAHIYVYVCIYIYHKFIAPHLLLMHHVFLILCLYTHTHTHTHTHTLLFFCFPYVMPCLILYFLLYFILFAVKLPQCSRRIHICINIV